MSDFENIINNHFGQNNAPELQRSADWFEARRGCFTGSKVKELMSCDRSAAKLEWGRPEKILMLGEAAKKYIYVKARERQARKIIKEPASYAMKFGTENETVIRDLFLYENTHLQFVATDFVKINEYLGASPDGLLLGYNEKFALEIKANTNFGSEFERVIEPFALGHIDFWQVQCEMLALQVGKCYYVAAEPPENIFEPVIEKINVQIVAAVPVLQHAILERARLGNDIIERYLAGEEFYEAVENSIINFKSE